MHTHVIELAYEVTAVINVFSRNYLTADSSGSIMQMPYLIIYALLVCAGGILTRGICDHAVQQFTADCFMCAVCALQARSAQARQP